MCRLIATKELHQSSNPNFALFRRKSVWQKNARVLIISIDVEDQVGLNRPVIARYFKQDVVRSEQPDAVRNTIHNQSDLDLGGVPA